MKLLVPLILAGLSCLAFITLQAVKRFPLKELRQRSRNGQRNTSSIYRLAHYGAAGRFILWLIATLSLANLLFIIYRHEAGLGWLVVGLASALATAWRPIKQPSGWAWGLAGSFASAIAYLLSFIKPLADSFNRWATRFHKPVTPTGIYEKSDLLELLRAQANQPENRVDSSDLQRAASSLTFDDKKVSDIMLPRKNVKWLAAAEAIGPSIMDELHKTGQTRFAVVRSASKTATPDVVGSLYIGKLLQNLDEPGKIRDLMSPGAFYISENSHLGQALEASLKTGSHLLLAVDDRAEITGVVTLDQILGQALGEITESNFDRYDDPRRAADQGPTASS